MSLPKIVTPSVSDLMERIRRKTHEVFVALHPAVKQQIEHLKDAKRWGARTNQDEDYRTVNQVDLTHAIRTGVLVHVEELDDCFEGVINGVTSDGIKITVTVHFMKDTSEPLVIMTFEFLLGETDVGD